MRNLDRFISFISDPYEYSRVLIGAHKEPLFLHQMGKVASVTIANTLNLDFNIIHTHTGNAFTQHLERKKIVPSKDRPLKLITILRDPVSRKKSVFFQNLVKSPYSFSFDSRADALSATPQELMERYLSWSNGYSEATTWYDLHFKNQTNIDVYDHPFDVEKGWQIIKTGNVEILILRFEDINRNYLTALNQYVCPTKPYARLRSGNVSSEKWYGERLKAFNKLLTYDPEELDSVYSSRYMLHFYSPDEIASFRKRFLKGNP